MRKLICQHWTGDSMPEIVTRSNESIRAWANSLEADYRLFRGQVFRPRLSPPCQKVFMLNEALDEYDVVVMVDADMFAVPGTRNDIFAETGVGIPHPDAHRRMLRKNRLVSADTPFFGGAIYRMDRALRQLLRAQIIERELDTFTGGQGNSEDEGIIHRLMWRAGIRNEDAKRKGMLLDPKWAWSSYLPMTGDEPVIHIRAKYPEGGTLIRCDKMTAYGNTIARGAAL